MDAGERERRRHRHRPPHRLLGGRLMATLLNELERTGGRYGLQTMCEGGGQANATIIERLG
jgi:acetyl-CoA acetyltransferase